MVGRWDTRQAKRRPLIRFGGFPAQLRQGAGYGQWLLGALSLYDCNHLYDKKGALPGLARDRSLGRSAVYR
jgi:hypothetical protein